MNENFALICILILFFGIFCSIARLMKGPTLFDRILAAEGITLSINCFLILLAITSNSPFYIDILLLISLLGFITPVAFIDFMHYRQEHPDD